MAPIRRPLERSAAARRRGRWSRPVREGRPGSAILPAVAWSVLFRSSIDGQRMTSGRAARSARTSFSRIPWYRRGTRPPRPARHICRRAPWRPPSPRRHGSTRRPPCPPGWPILVAVGQADDGERLEVSALQVSQHRTKRPDLHVVLVRADRRESHRFSFFLVRGPREPCLISRLWPEPPPAGRAAVSGRP